MTLADPALMGLDSQFMRGAVAQSVSVLNQRLEDVASATVSLVESRTNLSKLSRSQALDLAPSTKHAKNELGKAQDQLEDSVGVEIKASAELYRLNSQEREVFAEALRSAVRVKLSDMVRRQMIQLKRRGRRRRLPPPEPSGTTD